MALTIRQSEEFKQAIEEIRTVTGVKSASKIVERCVFKYLSLEGQLQEKKDQVNSLALQIQKIATVLLNKEQCDKQYDQMINNLQDTIKITSIVGQ